MRMRGSMVEIQPLFFRQLEEFIADNARIAESVHWALDAVIMGYAYVTVGFAQKKSAGVIDPQEKNKAAAWLVPVRRISGQYYMGWRAERLAPSVWQVTNDSREAYYIEFGINHSGTGKASSGGGANVRVRRPILKLSIMEAVAFAAGSQFDIKAVASMWKMSSAHSPLQNRFAGIPTSSGGNFFLSGMGVIP